MSCSRRLRRRTALRSTVARRCRGARFLGRHRRRVIRRTGGLGWHYAFAAELAGLSRRCHCRTAVIVRGPQSGILPGRSHMLHLCRNRRRMRLPRVSFFSRRRPRLHSTLSAVERNVRLVVHDDGLVDVDVGDVNCAYIHHGGIVEKRAAAPFAAAKAASKVTEAVVNAAVKADLGAPVAAVPCVGAVVPTPVTGRPKEARLRSLHPGSRHPIVAVIVIPCPVAGSPQITFAGTQRHLVNRQRRRTDAHRDANADLRRRC
jgi:hypothetical protein